MNPSIHNHLPLLLTMAHDRSEAGRVTLAGKLSELFLTEDIGLTHREEMLVTKLVEDLLHHENPRVRQTLIDHFAQAVNAPRQVALRIVQAPIEIARGVLSNNENLNDDDLISIIQDKSEDHAAAIANRKAISEAVADALVTTGSIMIMRLVAENLGAKISPKAMDVLTEAARLAVMLQKPILSRPEITGDQAARLIWWVEKDLRRATMERFGYGPGKLEAALEKTVDEKLNAHIFEANDDIAMAKIADWMDERDALTIKMLAPILRMGHYRLFMTVLARMNKMDLSIADTMFEKYGSRVLVALCRALGMDKGTFISVFLMSRGAQNDEQIVHPQDLSATLQAFDRLKPSTAVMMVNSWRANPDAIIIRAGGNADDLMSLGA